MPRSPFKTALRRYDSGLDVVVRMSELCKTSLTATAIRYAELTEDAIAVIVSIGPIIDYCFLSETMRSVPELRWPKKGDPVPTSTRTAWFNAEPTRILNAERVDDEIDLLDWLGGQKPAIVSEEVIGLGGYEKTLTILSSDSLGQDDEDELIESWTPRFR
ncbi:MAG: hypothetical protein FE835_13265 [Gammaproteobacteria bacterium]|nr:hypothetical protein [Gammaproteobacteria bacterium]